MDKEFKLYDYVVATMNCSCSKCGANEDVEFEADWNLLQYEEDTFEWECDCDDDEL